MPTLQFFPFGPGLHQENDSRLQNAGTPRAVENLIRTKNGRLCARRDYETLAMTVASNQTGLQLFDLHSFQEKRLIGIGHSDSSGMDAVTTIGATVVYEFVNQASFAWLRTNQSALSPATQLRNVGALGKQQSSATIQDAAAGLGLVCEVFDMTLTFGGVRTVVHVFSAETDGTVFMTEFTSRSLPRVVFCGGSFFITMAITATGEVELYRYTPGAAAMVQLTSPVAAVATIDAYDFALSHEGTTMWLAAARSNTTTALRGMSSAGAVTYTAAGPAVLYDSLSILVHSTVAATQRLHILGVRDTTGTMDLVTYLPPATAPATTSNNIFTPAVTTRQASLAVRDIAAGATTQIVAMYQRAFVGGDQATDWVPINAVTHALGVTEERLGRLTSKLANIDSILVFGMGIQEGATTFTAALANIFRDQRFLARPVTVIDRLLSADPAAFHLPKISKDTSTGLSYWPRLTKTSDAGGQPRISEMKLNATDRRQSVEIGSAMYLAGGIMHVFDLRCVGEAGGFLTRPYIYLVSQLNTASGALTLLGTYQMVSKFELVDSMDRRMQSAPSDVAEFTLTGANDTLSPASTGVFSYWDRTESDLAVGTARATPFLVTYRTLDTNAGNITLHRDTSEALGAPWGGSGGTPLLIQSDIALSDEEVLYTQGARGSLSGPLEFITPDPCTTLAASADRILSGGLPRSSAIQESRPLLIGEQVQWSDSIGFYRDIRGRVLLVARLDERRIMFTSTEIFEADGPGVDDNGLGEIGAPRRLPSDVGLYGGVLGWRSVVEMSAGIMFQGLSNQIYLLPRGGVTPVPIGFPVEDKLAAYPTISAAVYMNEDQTVRFCCNNVAGTESIVLLFNVRFTEWFVEGPYAFTIRAAAKANGLFHLLTSLNTVLRQRTPLTPLAFVANAWRSGVVHPAKPGMFFRSNAFWFYGTYNGDCRIRCIVKYDERDTETHEYVEVFGRAVGSQFVFRFEFDQTKCESVQVDFEVVDLQGAASQGLDYTYWAIEGEPADTPNEVGPEDMT